MTVSINWKDRRYATEVLNLRREVGEPVPGKYGFATANIHPSRAILFYFVVLGVVSFRVLSRVLQSMFEDDR